MVTVERLEKRNQKTDKSEEYSLKLGEAKKRKKNNLAVNTGLQVLTDGEVRRL